MKFGALVMGAVLFVLIGTGMVIAPHTLHAEDTVTALFDASYTDTEWNIQTLGGHYKYFFRGYESLGNPPTTTGHTWTATGDVTTARIKVAPGTTCNQFMWGGSYGVVLWTENFSNNYESNPRFTTDLGGGVCEFTFYSAIPAGTALGAAFLTLSEAAFVMGSSENPGVSLTGTYDDPVNGGFALQLCGTTGCSGGFVASPEPAATTTEETATTTTPVPDPEETATSTPDTSDPDPEETATTTTETPATTEETSSRSRHRSSRIVYPVFTTPAVISAPAITIPPPVITPAPAAPRTNTVIRPEPAATPVEPEPVALATTTITQVIPIEPSPEILPEAPESRLVAGALGALPPGMELADLLYIPLLLALLILLLILLLHVLSRLTQRSRSASAAPQSQAHW